MEAKGNGVSGVQRNVDKSIDTYSKTAHQAVDRAAEAASSVASRLGERVDALGEKGAVLIASVLIVTAWMGGVAALIVLMLGGGISWPAAIGIAAVLNLVGAGALAWWMRHLVAELPFT